MRLLFALTYYHPHVSGLTIFVERLAEALAARGHNLTVLTSRYADELAREETIKGVRVVRVPSALRVGKGQLMPSYAGHARALVRGSDAVVINLPNTPVESLTLSMLARRCPVVVLYHCDLRLPRGIFNRAANEAVRLSNFFAARRADRIVTHSGDYARHSRFLRRFADKCEAILPSVEIPPPDSSAVEAFRRRHAPGGEPLIGLAGRFAAEKGVEYLLDALPLITQSTPRAKIVFTGDPASVVGEQAYWRRLQPQLARARDQCTFLGMLDRRELPAFYAACDVTVLPSTNSTEAFGLVQLESMLCGTPVVASDLPGVRVPVMSTGMGRIVAPRDTQSLARALVEVIQKRDEYVRPRAEVEKHFSFETTVRSYEELFERLTSEGRAESPRETVGELRL